MREPKGLISWRSINLIMRFAAYVLILSLIRRPARIISGCAQAAGLCVSNKGIHTMQCPPTSPGRNGKKFHFVPAAYKTASVSIPTFSKITANSLIKAIFTSLCIFNNLCGLGNTNTGGTKCASGNNAGVKIIDYGNTISGVEPEVTFTISEIRCALSPRFMRSGL